MPNALETVPEVEALSKTRLRLWLKLLKASRRIEEDLRKKLRDECQWTMPRFDVMAALARSPEGLKMTDISKRLRMSNGNITGIVDKLTEEGLAQRVSKPGDRRAHLVQLTDAGAAIFAQNASLHEAWVDALLEDYDFDQATQLMAHLSAMSDPKVDDQRAAT